LKFAVYRKKGFIKKKEKHQPGVSPKFAGKPLETLMETLRAPGSLWLQPVGLRQETASADFSALQGDAGT